MTRRSLGDEGSTCERVALFLLLMRTATIQLASKSPYSQSAHYDKRMVPKNDVNEGADAYEDRTWRNRCHVDPEGHIEIPGVCFKNCLAEAAKFTAMSVPGKGKATFTKHFEAGVLIMFGIQLPETLETVECDRRFVPADGRRGGSSRVWRNFPIIKQWSGTLKALVIDATITEEVFLTHLDIAGNFIGIGRYRPRNNGHYGRFEVKGIKWKEGL